MFDEVKIAAQAIADRLLFNDEHQRADITDYAVVARDFILGKHKPDAALLAQIHKEAGQIEAQLNLEANFPAGVRIGTFLYSPVRSISALANGCPSEVPTKEADLLDWLRRETGWENTIDHLIDIGTGVTLPVLARELAKLHLHDPVSFYLLMCFEFEHPNLDTAVAYPPSKKRLRERLWPFHIKAKLFDVMTQIAEWRRAVAICRYLIERENADHLALRHYVQMHSTGLKPPAHIETIFDAMPLPVPMLRACLDSSIELSGANMMAEFERVMTPTIEHGNGTRRPLYHYYGLNPVEVLMVAFLDTMCARRGIAPSSNAINDPHVRKPNFEHFGQDRLKTVIVVTLDSLWPNRAILVKEDAALRSKILRRRYARASAVAGSAYRFDPAFWSRPERDARMFERLATKPNGASGSDSFPNLVALIRDTLLAIMPINMTIDLIPFCSRVVAQLMTGTTVLTRDPVLLELLYHTMWQAGYRANRKKCSKYKCRKNGHCICNGSPSVAGHRTNPVYAARNWGCVLPVGKIRLRRPPELPLKGYS